MCEFLIFDHKGNEIVYSRLIKYRIFLQARMRCPLATPTKVFNYIFLNKFVWVLSNFYQKGMKLHIWMPININSLKKRSVLAKPKQYYSSKIVYLLQDNEIIESSPKALKDAETWELPGALSPRPLPGALPLDTIRGPKAGPWTPPVIARTMRSMGTILTSCPRRHIH